MREVVEDVKIEVRGAWRFRWPAMVVAWLVCLVGWFAVFLMPDKYAAEAQFYVDPTSRIQELMKGMVVDADEDSQLALVREAMLSRPTLEAVARETDLDLRARTPEEKEALIDTLRATVKIDADKVGGRRGGGGNLYQIRYLDVERQMSRDVVDAMLEAFRSEFVTGLRGGTDEAMQFLELKVEDYERQLQQREKAVSEFKRRYMGLLPGEGGGYFENLQAAMGDLEALESQLRVAVNRRNALRAQLHGGAPATGDDASPDGSEITVARTELEERIVELEANLDNLLLSYTERHPDVVATKTRLEQLYERRQREREAMAEFGALDAPASDNPVVQELQIALNETDIVITDLEQQVAAQRRRVADLQAKVDVLPEIERELGELTRDYDHVKRTYDQLLERLNDERLFEEKGEFEGSNFRIVQPPVASLNPVEPNRPRLFVAVLFGSFMAAGGLAYLLHLIRPVFVNPRSLRQVTGLPVLGSISMAWLSRHRTRRLVEAGSLAVVGGLLVLVLILVLVFQDVGVEAGEKIRRMAEL